MAEALPNFSVVVAADAVTGGIGFQNNIPWRIPEDMTFFKNLTEASPDSNKFNIVIMGRKTYDSIPHKHRPLANRVNVIISRTLPTGLHPDFSEETPVLVTRCLSDALLGLELLKILGRGNCINEIFVVGGGQIYAEAIRMPQCKRIYYTAVHTPAGKAKQFDTYFPPEFKNFYTLTDMKTGEKSPLADGTSYFFQQYEPYSV